MERENILVSRRRGACSQGRGLDLICLVGAVYQSDLNNVNEDEKRELAKIYRHLEKCDRCRDCYNEFRRHYFRMYSKKEHRIIRNNESILRGLNL